MKKFYKPFINLGIGFLLLSTFAQAQYVEFVQNKGQWDASVLYKGDMGFGEVYLQKTGYTVNLNNADDLNQIAVYYGGHTNLKGHTSTHSSKNTQTNLTVPSTSSSLILHAHAYEVIFENASNPLIVPDKPLSGYNNYFIGNDSSKWASQCEIYQAVLYKNLYKGIDVRYYTDNGKLKYEFIVHPGADITQIAMRYNGVDKLQLKNGNLIIQTSVMSITELAPVTYQINEFTKIPVKAKYVLKNNTIRFQIDNFDANATLIIDPTLVFAGFSGSRADNWGYTATYDASGNFYAGGIVFGPGFPVSVGAYQINFAGGDNSEGTGPYDIGIIKFNANGSQRLYATYIGGNGDEQPHSMVVDNDGNLIVAGRTSSGNNFPSTQPVFGSGGSADIFIAKLSLNGSALLASRMFGGSALDGVNIRQKYVLPDGEESIRRNYGDDARSEVIVDKNNNIYLASCTQSSSFPTTPSAFQTTLSGRQDGVVIKTNSNLSNVLFSTLLGGSGDDAAFVLALEPVSNDILVGGGTTSNNFPVQGSVLYGSYQGGICDGFATLLSNNGSTILYSSYIGTGGNDIVYGVQYDKFGFPYIMGTTTGAWPVVNASFLQNNGKQFIAKLKPDLSAWEYSTVFGTGRATPDISPTAFLVDRCENVYVSGWGGSINEGQGYPHSGTFNLSVTPNAIMSNTDGQDFYFFILEKNAASQLYGSFYGNIDGFSDHVDGGTSRFNKEGVIYQAVCANCEKLGYFPTTPGVFSPANMAINGSLCNLAGIKIAFEQAGVSAGLRSSINGIPNDTSGCVPLTVLLEDTLKMGKKYEWSFGDGSPDTITTTPAVSHIYNATGNYLVRLISIDSNTCNIADTAFLTLRVRDNKADLGFTYSKLLPCTSLNYQFTNTSVAPPALPFQPNSFEWNFGDGVIDSINFNPQHSFPAPGSYLISLTLKDTNYCNAPEVLDSLIFISDNVKAQFKTPSIGCAPYDAIFENTSFGGQTFEWNFGDGSTSNEVNPVHHYADTGTYVIRLVAVDSFTCNITDTFYFALKVVPKPTANFSYLPMVPQENTAIRFINNSLDATYYKWDFGDGDTLITRKKDTLLEYTYLRTGTYKVCLSAYNNQGCVDDTCMEVQTIIVPDVDVPNAFTPNGDGINDFVRVRGFGIIKMNWQIYNRWGVKVFESSSINNGWDGKYKGTLQPQEVYNYVLSVEFSDGTKYQKKGDITLLR